jgi:hypothetical protein
MTTHQHPTFRTVLRLLRPSPASIAGAAAVYEPWLLLQLKAVQG